MRRGLTLFLLLFSGSSALAQSPEADFDSGSMGRARNLSLPADTTSAWRVASRYDPRNPADTALQPSSRWFHFRLTGMRDRQFFLTLPNSEFVRPFYSTDGRSYHRFDEREMLFPHGVQHVCAAADTLYVAYAEPYPHSRHVEKIAEWSASEHVRVHEIGRSGEGRPIQLLTITDNPSARHRIWIHARVHPSETPSAWHIEAIVERLLRSPRLLENAVFYIVPEPNPDGVAGGFSRSTASGVNMEIDWARPDSLTTPEVRALKRAIDSLTRTPRGGTRPLDMALNLHSQSTPIVSCYIHSASSSSMSWRRGQLFFSSLLMAHTPLYRVRDQRFSHLAPHYPEGWFRARFGDRTLAITLETPYTYFCADPAGQWVSKETIDEMAAATLLSISDLFDLSGIGPGRSAVIGDKDERNARIFSDVERAASTADWERIADGSHLFFGRYYLRARRAGATANIYFKNVPRGSYRVFRWTAGPPVARDSRTARRTQRAADQPHWLSSGRVTQKQDGPLTWNFRSARRGDPLDGVMLVPAK